MSEEYIVVEQSSPLEGEVSLCGAKNAVLAVMASLLLTRGESVLTNVPASTDVLCMIDLLSSLGARVTFDNDCHVLCVNTRDVSLFDVSSSIMSRMRASILVMGPLLARFSVATVAYPGGCNLGARPIDFHLKGFKELGVELEEHENFLEARVKKNQSQSCRVVLEYPSVGATENVLMFSCLREGEVTIVNAALEPEVLDLVVVLKKMGADITLLPGSFIRVRGVKKLHPIEHEVVVDRLEAGA